MMKRGEGGAHESQTAWDEIVEAAQHTEARNTQVLVEQREDKDDLFIAYYEKATFLIYYTILK